MSGYLQALPFTLGVEGGFSDEEHDRGGATNYGVTQKVYDAYRLSVGKPRQDVRKITVAEVEHIYMRDYWLPGHCDALPWPASRAHFDACVNHGVRAAIKILQRAVGVTDDGDFGPKTQAAVDAAASLTDDLLWMRLSYYSAIVAKDKTQLKFLRGWLNRTIQLRRAA